MPLTQQQASERSAVVKKNSISYTFCISLSAETSFKGHAQIKFDLISLPTNPLLVDFSGRLINNLTINSKKIEEPNLDLPGFIQLDPTDLVLENNSLSINYECDYTNDGAGCVVYSEKEGDVKSKYLYTQFEPYDANKVFPCFDQPDLKAPMELTVLSPVEWTVFSNENTTSDQIITPTHQNHHHFLPEFIRNWIHRSPILDNFLQWLRPHNHQQVPETPYRLTSFKQTEKISTYLYCFVAGNYRTITEEGPLPETRNFRLTIASIESYLGDLTKISKFIFQVTSLSIDWFQKFFHYKYPFSKFDQIWVHEYAAGAMENAGIVTYNDARCLYKDDPTNNQLFDLANTIVHELSHHWFGNLVTMKWWDDLWLNESFADFISYFCLNDIASKITENGAKFDSGLAFMVNRTLWGYTQDQRETTTHPIRAIVADTTVASSIFDGITYAKGAASLQQLLFLMNRDNFSAGLGDYFKKFEWSNATADDFIGELSKHFDAAGAGFTLEQWNDSWLKIASLNVFEVSWDPSDVSSEAVLTIRQRPYSKQYPELRHHRVKIGFFDKDANCTEQILSVNTQQITQIKYDGTKHIQAILFNHHNQTFAEAYIDDISLSFFRTNLNKITDTLTRTSIWFRIIAMVENSRLSVSEFTAWANQLIFDEHQDFLFDQVLTKLRQSISANSKIENRGAQLSIIYKHLLSILSQNKEIDRARLQLLKGKLISYAGATNEIQSLHDWLNKTGPLAHRALDLGQKWNIVQKLYTLQSLTVAEKKAIFDSVAVEEQTDRKQLVWNTCSALVADDKAFGQIYELFRVENSPLSVAVKQSHAAGWRSCVHYDRITNEYRAKYFADIAGLKDVLKGNHFKSFYDLLRPLDDNLADQVNHYTNATLSLTGDSLSKHYRDILKIIDDLNRRIRNYHFNDDTDNTLTQTRAEARFKLIGGGKINYNVHLAFENESLSFTGFTEIRFTLKQLPEVELPVDLTIKSITTLIINGVHAVPITRGEFLILKKEWLHVGQNTVAVLYKAGYYNDGYGCIYYRDSTSGQLYLYTTFEPRSAYKVFPCFDQPDLKAQITFNCIGQVQKWKIISNEAPIHVSPFIAADYKAQAILSYNPKHDALLEQFITNQKGTFYIFPQTKLLPTYLYCLIVGDYYQLNVKPEEQFKTLPMKLYCIQPLKEYLNKLGSFIFEITRLSLAFFEKNFGYDYPFSKYDQVFAHEYKMGAMQNPGVVTFNDTYLYKEAVPTEDMLVLANTIAHEASHHWFGDLVTMKWWNDLWLNESFADFISHYCLEHIKDEVKTITYTSGWAAFVERKVRGYTEDQMVTTHPIRGPVPNTSVAGSIFDGITYQKGASTLKQLMFVMGSQAFFAGLKKYFNEMEWKNGTIDDFLFYMEESFNSHYPENFTLQDWKAEWLLTSSLNIFEVEWDVNNHAADAVLTLKQKVLTSTHNHIRHHKLVLAFFRKDHSVKRIEVNVDGLAETKVSYDGSEQFVGVLVNLDDEGFVKYRPDPVSLAYFRANINKIENQVTRMLIWHHFNELVRDSILSVKDYTQTALENIFNEKEDRICKFVFNFLQESSLFQKGAVSKVQRDLIFKSVYNHLASLTTEQQIKSNRAIILRNQLVRFPVTEDQIHTLQEWRQDKNESLKKLTPSINQGWSIVELVYTSSKYTLEQKQNIFTNQKCFQGNTQDDIIVAQIICDGLVSTDERYEEIYKIFHQTDNSVTVKRVYASGWATKHHLKRMLQYKDKYFEDIIKLSFKIEGDHFNAFYDLLKPIDEQLDINIALFEAIQLDSDGKFDSDRTSIKKIVDLLKRRRTAHAFNV